MRERKGGRPSFRRDFGASNKPVKEGDVVKVKVESKGQQGDGVAKIQGYVIFVKGDVKEGEEYEVKITSVGRKFATAVLASS
ncbi:MAG: TRAM domain-containing protein [Candidatus Anstonellales archaeon]